MAKVTRNTTRHFIYHTFQHFILQHQTDDDSIGQLGTYTQQLQSSPVAYLKLDRGQILCSRDVCDHRPNRLVRQALPYLKFDPFTERNFYIYRCYSRS